jgi:hypothetical protein
MYLSDYEIEAVIDRLQELINERDTLELSGLDSQLSSVDQKIVKEVRNLLTEVK